jgi:hypothetical protein
MSQSPITQVSPENDVTAGIITQTSESKVLIGTKTEGKLSHLYMCILIYNIRLFGRRRA